MPNIVDPAEPLFERLEAETKRIEAQLGHARDRPRRRRLQRELRRVRRQTAAAVARRRPRDLLVPW